MKRIFLYMLLCIMISICFFVSAYSQEDMVAVDNSVFENPQRTASIFNHDDHNEAAGLDEECNECHHLYEDGKKVEDESSEDDMCSECHEMIDSGNMPGLMKAYHLNCKGCHLNQNTIQFQY